MARTLLSIYLNDHLAGATAGVALARRAAKHNEGTPAGRRLAQVAHEIEDDREALKRLISELGMHGSPLKNAVAWVMERAARLKPNGRVGGKTELHRMHELEALSLGIAGKQALWSALRVAPQAPAIAGLDLDELEERARSQRERVEMERIALARTALTLAPEGAQRVEQPEQTPVGGVTR